MTMITADDDDFLLKRYASTQDPQAFAQLARRYAGLVFSVARRITGSVHDAEDVAQTSFLELAKNARSVRSVAGFLHRTATHRAMNLRRDNAARIAREREPRPENETDCDELLARVDAAIDQLPNELRVVLVLHYQQSQSQSQIAGALGVSQATISRRLESAVVQLRSTLGASKDQADTRQQQISTTALTAALVRSASVEPNQSLLNAINKIGLAVPVRATVVTGSIAILLGKIAAVLVLIIAAGVILVLSRGRHEPILPAVQNLPVVATTAPAAAPVASEPKSRLSIAAIPQLASITMPEKIVSAAAISPDGKYIIAASNFRQGNRPAGMDFKTSLVLFDAVTQQKLREFSGHERYIAAVKFSPNGKTFASASRDGTCRIWDVQTGKQLHRFEVKGTWFLSVDFSSDGKQLLAGGWGGMDDVPRSSTSDLFLWDINTEKPVVTFEENSVIIINSVAMSRDGRFAAAGTNGNYAALMDIKTGHEVMEMHDDGDINAVAFSPDSTRILTAGNAEILTVWDVTHASQVPGLVHRSPRLIERLEGHDDVINAVAFTDDGKRAISVGGKENLNGRGQGEVRLWDLAGKKQIACSRLARNSVHAVSVTADSSRAVVAAHDGTVSTFDLTRQNPPVLADQPNKQLVPEFRNIRGLPASVEVIQFIDGGKKLFACANASTICILNVEDGKLLRQVFFNGCFAAGFAPPGDILGFSATQLQKSGLDPKQRDQLFDVIPAEQHRDAITSWNIPIFGDSQYALLIAQRQLILWDNKANQAHWRIDTPNLVRYALVSPDGSTILTSQAEMTGFIRLYSTADGKLIKEMATKDTVVYPLLFAPDGKTYFRPEKYGQFITRCDTQTGAVVQKYQGHKETVEAMAISPDGQTLVSSSRDKTIRVWDAQTGDPIAKYDVKRLYVSALAIAPDNKTVASDNPDGSISLWELPGDGM